MLYAPEKNKTQISEHIGKTDTRIKTWKLFLPPGYASNIPGQLRGGLAACNGEQGGDGVHGLRVS